MVYDRMRGQTTHFYGSLPASSCVLMTLVCVSKVRIGWHDEKLRLQTLQCYILLSDRGFTGCPK